MKELYYATRDNKIDKTKIDEKSGNVCRPLDMTGSFFKSFEEAKNNLIQKRMTELNDIRNLTNK